MGWAVGPGPCSDLGCPHPQSRGGAPTVTHMEQLPAHALSRLSACFPALSPCIPTRRPLSLAPIYREDTEAQGRKDSCPGSPSSQALRLRFEPMSAAFGLLKTCTP